MIRQLHYTSTETGRDGVQGFQVSAVTPGLEERHQDTAIGLGVYRVPPDFPFDPTEEDLSRSPVSLGYLRTADAVFVFRSVYVGADFTGRQGNYFAHSLVLDDVEELGDLLPIDLWDARVWSRRSPASGSLPTVDQLAAGRLAQPRRTREFLLAGGRLTRLPEVLTAVRGAVADQRRVLLVCPGSDEAAGWIGAVLRSLPRAYALDLPFTTFSATPGETQFLLVATTPDVRLSTNPYDQPVVVDLTGTRPAPKPDAAGRHEADPPAGASRYAQVVRYAWETDEAQVADLVRTADQVRPPLSAEEYDQFADGWSFLVGNAIPAERLADAAEFVLARLPHLGTDRLLEHLARAVTDGRPLAEPRRWSAMLREVGAGGRALPPDVERAYLAGVLAARAPTGAAPGDQNGLWLPDLSHPWLHDVVSGWLVEVLAEADEHLSAAAPGATGPVDAALTAVTLAALFPAAEQRRIADAIGSVLRRDPADEVWRAIAARPALEPLVGRLAAALSPRGEDELLALTSVLPAAAVAVLAPVAQPASGLGLAVAIARARTGTSDRLQALREILGRSSRRPAARTIGLLTDQLWPADLLPTAAELAGIHEMFAETDAGSAAGTSFATRAVERLLADAHGPAGLGGADHRLANRLGTDKQARGSLAAAQRRVVDAIRLDGYFRSMPRADETAEGLARNAVDHYPEVVQAIGGRLMDAVAAWLLSVSDPAYHLRLLRELAQAGGLPFQAAYSRRAGAVLTGQPETAVWMIAVWHALDRGDPFGAQLMRETLAEAVARLHRREADAVEKAFGTASAQLCSALPGTLDRGWDDDWARWWRAYRSRHHRTLIGRLRRSRRDDGQGTTT
ncbi:GAP1-N2 domain-containing protein [Frankia sp. AgKG'84/4]|uniref:GAP1-N2 domain-containing protein n=1 Tax=Frankia sp. AgKG'84/4 TaxID=573490 RepID=UPI00200E9435|nr:hypothetical protein [Frankia sp. AgKG'84/4]MCL9793080.1 hypothetical protein [Frankia sp. AgKG'84/4]